MTYNIYALTNDKAQLLVKKASVSYDANMAHIIIEQWESEGYFVCYDKES